MQQEQEKRAALLCHCFTAATMPLLLPSRCLSKYLPLSSAVQLPSRTDTLLRMRQEREEMEALRKDPLQFDPDAEARKRLAETKAALAGHTSKPAAAAKEGGLQVLSQSQVRS